VQVKYAARSLEYCINLCVSTKSVENIFCFCARGCVVFEDVAGGLLCVIDLITHHGTQNGNC
jgi:hypothetical protein